MDKMPLRIALVMGKMNRGGVEAIIVNYYRAIDHTKVQFDFFVDSDSSFPQRAELERLGAGIFMVPPYQKLPVYLHTLTALFKKGKYAIVHANLNTMSVFPLFAAWLAGVPVRICHNHSTAAKGEGKKTLLKMLLRPFAKVFATDYFACSEVAGRWLFGDACYAAGKVTVWPNAIDWEQFAYSAENRAEVRQKWNAQQNFVVGHIGRFTYAKNHDFLLRTFAKFHALQPQSVLWLVGEGELLEQTEQKVLQLGIGESVKFLGVCSDTAELYNGMDVFVLPSVYEGFPVVGVEAQANGLPCLFSADVPAAACFTKNSALLPLAAGADAWADKLREIEKEARMPSVCSAEIVRQFSIESRAVQLMQWYLIKAKAKEKK
ncbi:MAG: glycosyltransferase family 1 protein [Ruthenibacterium sp.]